MFGSAPAYVPPPQPTPPPAVDDPAAKEAARKQAQLNASLMGRGATLIFGAATPDPSRRKNGQPGASLVLGSPGSLGNVQ